MTPRLLDQELTQKADELLTEMHTREWLLANDCRRPDAKQVKIAEGVYVIQNMLKTPGGSIRVTAVNQDGVLHDVHISGDFFIFPSDRLMDLELVLDGSPTENDVVSKAVADFYERHDIESPGVIPADFARVLTM